MSAPRPRPQIAVAYHLALEHDLTAHQTLVLIALAEMAWDGLATVPMATVARKSRQSLREAIYSVRALASRRLGLIEVIERPGQPNQYRMLFGSNDAADEHVQAANEETTPKEPLHSVHPPAADPCTECTPLRTQTPPDPCTACTPTPAHRAPQVPLSKNPLDKEESKGSAPASRRAYADDGFDAFWENYPRKRSKDDARKAFAARLRAGVAAEEILAGLARHKFNPVADFVPYPATWLRAGSWQDEPERGPWEWLDSLGVAGRGDDWDGTTVDGEVSRAGFAH